MLLKLDVDKIISILTLVITARVADFYHCFYLQKICAQCLTAYQNWKNGCRMSLVYIAGYVVVRSDGGHLCVLQEVWSFFNDLNRDGLKIPEDSACQWSFYSYVMFREVVLSTCRISLCNILMVISEFHELNMERKYGMVMANILFNNHAHLYTPRSSKERKQKALKRSDQ